MPGSDGVDAVDGIAAEPLDLERLFVARVNAGDIEGLLELFEPDALMAHDDGVAVGHTALRPVFERMVAAGMRLTLGDQQVPLVVGDLALTSTRLADGGITAEIARRQPDGTWRWVVDQWNVLD